MITSYFGMPGCGKTTFLAKIAHRELRRIRRGKSKYKRVYSNTYIKGCYKLHYSELPFYDFSYCLILLDELTLDADSRSFKTFTAGHKEFFLMHRHYRCDVVYATQQYDAVDKKIRDITNDTYYVRKGMFFSSAMLIPRGIIIPEQTGDIVQGYHKPRFFQALFKRHVFRPLYYRYFDSYCRPDKDSPPEVMWDFKTC